ncbi:hypothetical protein H4582DRAFT_2078109 [Lactarius indigo]|nr:hypothetical protein H4582DRAFT_2078109 [Lactarius indigo]
MAPHAGSLPVLNSNHPPCDQGQGLTGGGSRVNHLVNDTDTTTGAPSTIQPDNITTAISAEDMDAEDHTDTADITDAIISKQLTLANEKFAAYPEQELLEDLAVDK